MSQIISYMLSRWTATRGDDRGAGLVEYGLLVTFIALAAIAGLTAFGVALSDFFSTLIPF